MHTKNSVVDSEGFFGRIGTPWRSELNESAMTSSMNKLVDDIRDWTPGAQIALSEELVRMSRTIIQEMVPNWTGKILDFMRTLTPAKSEEIAEQIIAGSNDLLSFMGPDSPLPADKRNRVLLAGNAGMLLAALFVHSSGSSEVSSESRGFIAQLIEVGEAAHAPPDGQTVH